METRTPACPLLRNGDTLRLDNRRGRLTALVSVAVHLAALVALTLDPSFTRPRPLVVDEPIAVELVEESDLRPRTPRQAADMPIARVDAAAPEPTLNPGEPDRTVVAEAPAAPPVRPDAVSPDTSAPSAPEPPPAPVAGTDVAQPVPEPPAVEAVAGAPPAALADSPVPTAPPAGAAPAEPTRPATEPPFALASLPVVDTGPSVSAAADPAASPSTVVAVQSAPVSAAAAPGPNPPAVEVAEAAATPSGAAPPPPDPPVLAGQPEPPGPVPRSEVTAVAAALPAPPAGPEPVRPAGVPSSMPVAAAETTVAAAAPVPEARQAASSPVSPASAGELTRPSEAARVAAVTGPAGPAMPPTAALPPAAPPSAATPADPVRGNRPEAVLAAALPLSDLRPRDPRDEIEATLKSFECARVSAALDPGSGSVVLKGHLRSASDRGRMADRIASLAGVDKVDGSGLSVVGEPYCRVLAFLDRPAFQRSTEQKHDLAVVGTTNQPGLKRLAGGEALSLGLGAPEFDSYLYVDHFSVDGRVTHLLPTDRPDNFFKADTGFRLGPGGYGRRAIASPPYGLDLVVVVAASEPLLVRPRPIQEDAAPYLALLNERVSALEASSLKLRVEYAYYLVATEPPRASQ